MLYVICRFLFDETCADYKYYEYRLVEEEKSLTETMEVQTSHSGEFWNFYISAMPECL